MLAVPRICLFVCLTRPCKIPAFTAAKAEETFQGIFKGVKKFTCEEDEQMEQMNPRRLHHKTENNCSGWVECRCSVSGYNWVLFLFPVNLCQNMSTFSLFPVFHHHLIFQPLWRKVMVEWVSTTHWAGWTREGEEERSTMSTRQCRSDDDCYVRAASPLCVGWVNLELKVLYLSAF